MTARVSRRSARGAKRPRTRGFTLLEVMVAIAILGLALTVILSAQGGLAASNQSASNMGSAISFGRCKMSELEERLLRLGYPEIDDLQTGLSCCGDDSGNYKCDTRIEKVELPAPPQNSLGDGGMLSLSGGDGGSPLAGASGAGLDFSPDAGLAGMGAQIQQQVPGGSAGLFSMAMSFVYPTLKAMMEASIRRLTVSVKWKEGKKERDFTIVQYVTNPQRAGFISGVVDPNAAGSATPASGAGAAPASGARAPTGGATK